MKRKNIKKAQDTVSTVEQLSDAKINEIKALLKSKLEKLLSKIDPLVESVVEEEINKSTKKN